MVRAPQKSFSNTIHINEIFRKYFKKQKYFQKTQISFCKLIRYQLFFDTQFPS